MVNKPELKLIQATTEDDEWDIVIKPKSSLFSLNLTEVWKYRELVWLFVKRDFVAQYKQTILGPVWHIVQPILTSMIFVLVFGKIANIPTDEIEPKFLFFLTGITVWNYFSGCLIATSNTFVANSGIFGKVYFPRLVLPLSVVMSNLIKFIIQFLLLITIICFHEVQKDVLSISINWLMLPLLVVMLAALGLGLGIIISSLTTKYKDLTVLIGFAVQLLMYATPIAYPLSFIANKNYGAWLKWNPLTPIVESFRYILFGKGNHNLGLLGLSAIFIILVLTMGLIIFNKVEKKFMDTI